MKKLVTLHMCVSISEWTKGETQVFDWDVRTSSDVMKERIWLGSQQVELDFPEIDIRQAQIDILDAQVQEERAQSQSRVNLLLERISKLKAICHDE